MIEMNKAVVPGGQVCLRVVPNMNKAAAGGRRLQNLVNVLGKGKLGGNIFISPPPPQLVAAAATTPIPIPIPRRRRLMATSNSSNADICHFIPSSSSFGDPCLDLFFNSLRPDDWRYNKVCLKYLKQLLPLAWSHNPLTTLKLIFSAQADGFDGMKFDTAVLWLHHNHPNTLLRNLHSLVNSVSYGEGLYTLVEILSNLLVQKRGGQDNDAAAHPERNDLDPDYRLLHDRVIDIFVELLKSDIDKMKHHKLKLKFLNDDDDLDDDFDQLDVDGFVSAAAECCTDKYPEKGHRARACAILLHESIGRRLFPPESDQSDEWERLRKEVLVPLSDYYRRQVRADCWYREVRERCVVEKYLEEVKAEAAAGGGGNLRGGIIKLDALLPNEIIKYVRREDVREAAEVQWKAMVEDIKQGEGLGKFKNCLVVGSYSLDYELDERYPERAYAEAGLEILVSEVNEEPWKGKVITYRDGKYRLGLIQGHNLTSKFEFMRSVETCWTSLVECNKEFLEVFDLILEVAVNEKLRAEQMIKKVIVFTEHLEPTDSPIWDVQYYALQSTFEAIRSKFRDKGYGDDSVPHILYFNESERPWICTQDPGFTLVSGFSNNMFKSFLKNGGEIGPHHLMEAAIAHEEYQTLEVVD